MESRTDPDFAAWVAARQQGFLHAAYLMCGDRTRAQDLLQDALLKVALRWSSLRDGNPDAYLRTILYRDSVSAWRRRRHEVLVDVSPEAGATPDAYAAADARVDIVPVLAALTHRQRAVVVLRFFEDRSVSDTALTLGISEGTVKSATHDALKRLRNALPQLLTVGVDP